MPPPLGYCTNVHAGATLDATREQLARHAVAVRRRIAPQGTLGIGLWLSHAAAESLAAGEVARFRDWLAAEGLLPYTLNGFPYGDFHQPVVKHRVYEPTWLEPARQEYTLRLVELLDALLPPGEAGTISTLPVAWGYPRLYDDALREAARRLVEVAERLEDLEQRSGRWIAVCLEPEPGCALGESRDVIDFFHDHLFPLGGADRVSRYLRVCHDVCHAAVMFESQRDVLDGYAEAGIAVGKVQISAAVEAAFPRLDAAARRAAHAELAALAEPRYLHQTMVQPDAREAPWNFQFFEDLPAALAEYPDAAALAGAWRVHFHVPIYLDQFGALGTTQECILDCLEALGPDAQRMPMEVETYAWGVLPEGLRTGELAEGIARELEWLAAARRP